MEQWMKDGRLMMFDRWKKMDGVHGSKEAPASVPGVDDTVLQHLLAGFAKNRLKACVSSQVLQSDICKFDSERGELRFRFSDGRHAPAIDRNSYFGLVQRKNDSSSASSASSSPPKPHSRVLIDYAWVFRDRIYDYTPNFSFIAGAGVVPQALEEAVLYCAGGEAVEALYEATSPSAATDGDSGKPELSDGVSLDGFEEFLCDSSFAFRDEGTRLPASEFTVGWNEEQQKRVAVKAPNPPMLIPPDATVALLVRVKRYCNPVSVPELIQVAEKLKNKGNVMLTGGEEQPKQEKHVDAAGSQESVAAAAAAAAAGAGASSPFVPTSTKHARARRWYEYAMQQLSPESMRTAGSMLGGNGNKDEDSYKKLLTSICHNISLCYFEEALALKAAAESGEKDADEQEQQQQQKQQDRTKISMAKRDLMKKSISFASEGIKLSQGKHSKSLYRRAAANAQLGNFEEAEGDLRNMDNLNPGAGEDNSVVALRAAIRDQVRKADSALRGAMKRGLDNPSAGADNGSVKKDDE